MVVGKVGNPRAAVAAGVLAAAALLGGCAQSPSDVAVVGDTTISRDSYESGVAVVRQLNPQLRPDQVLTVMIRAEVAAQAAERRGITITDGDRAELVPAEVLAIENAREIASDEADFQIVLATIGREEMTRELASADVTVNPRYGRWDRQQALGVVPDGGSLSKQASNRPQQ
jgi:hypothetical protein